MIFFLLCLIHLACFWKHDSPSNQITLFKVTGLLHPVILLFRWSGFPSLPLEFWSRETTLCITTTRNHRELEIHQTQHGAGGADLQFAKDSICAPSAQPGARPRITRSPLFLPLLIWANERKHESKFVKQHCMDSASFADIGSSHLSWVIWGKPPELRRETCTKCWH